MCVIALISDCFKGEQKYAQALAESLGYHLIEQATVIERAASWGACHSELAQALAGDLSLWDRLSRRKAACVRMLQAALAEEARSGNVICGGLAGYLLPKGSSGVIRIRLAASLEGRVAAVRKQLKLDEKGALEFVRTMDRARDKWLRYLEGDDWERCQSYDLVIDADEADSERVIETLVAFASAATRSHAQSDFALELGNLALARRLEAALDLDPASAGLNLDVSANRGAVAITGVISTEQELEAVSQVAVSLPGVTSVTLNGTELGRQKWTAEQPSQPAAQARGKFRFRLRPVWAVPIAAAALSLIFFVAPRLSNQAGAPATQGVFTGTVTDSLCGADHAGMDVAAWKECAKTCVRLGNRAKYALDDGKRLLILSDQQQAEEFAGERVKVNGHWDQTTESLKVESVARLL